MSLIQVFMRREPSSDSVLKQYAPGLKKNDVVVYRDRGMKERFGHFPWHYSNRPNKRSRTVTLNCYKWAAVWLPDAPGV